jgi:peptidoglycan-N-acetylglucosamine deacetylase
MIIRNIPESEASRKTLYLTFDDGPDAASTPSVLKTLEREQVLATFFVVATKAKAERALLERILADGHSIGNHSLDHGYRAFFASQQKMTDWVWESEQEFANLLVEPVGFRPPAGVVTPPLKRALASKSLPLVLWQTRFFDTTFTWSKGSAERSLRSAKAGDIILLHDRQPASRLDGFCETLEHYIRAARAQGFSFARLTSELCRKQSFVNET